MGARDMAVLSHRPVSLLSEEAGWCSQSENMTDRLSFSNATLGLTGSIRLFRRSH
jgi:hypothetical protein